MTILHGNNQTNISDALVKLIKDYKKNGCQVIRLEAKKLTLANLEQALQVTNLFGQDRLVVINHLFSLPRSKKRANFAKLIAKNTKNVILVEKRKLSKANLKHFPQAKIQLFKLSSALFSWLDSISSNKNSLKRQLTLLQKALEQDGAMMCLAMLARQIRLLIQAKENAKIKGPPFMVSKIKTQARYFSLEQLLNLHKKLCLLDGAEKTSTNLMGLEQSLEGLVIGSCG